MKKLKKTLLLLSLLGAAAMFVVSCGGSDADPGVDPGTPTEVTYTLNVPNVSVGQGNTATITYSLTASDNSSTATGFTVTFAAKAATTLTITGSSVSAPAAAPLGVQNFTATAKKGTETVATKDFTITVVPPGQGDVNYTLTVTTPVSVEQGGNVTVVYTLTASDSSSTTGIPVTIAYAGELNPSPFNVNGAVITAALDTDTTDVHSFTATAKKEGVTVATRNFDVSVTRKAARDVLVTVTLSDNPDAALKDGEYVWISGNFNNWENGSVVMDEQEDGTWTTTISDYDTSTSGTITFKVYAVASTVANNWTVVANHPSNNQTANIDSGVLNFTVQEWFGRPIVVEGNLFALPDFQDTAGDAWHFQAAAPWKATGIKDDWSTVWLNGDGHGGSGKCFYDANGASPTAGTPIFLYQEIDATVNNLTVGTKVTLSAYTTRLSADGSVGDFKLVCGSQTKDFDTPAMTADKAPDWTLLTWDFTLAAGDFVDGKLSAGLQWTPQATSQTKADDFTLVIVP